MEHRTQSRPEMRVKTIPSAAQFPCTSHCVMLLLMQHGPEVRVQKFSWCPTLSYAEEELVLLDLLRDAL